MQPPNAITSLSPVVCLEQIMDYIRTNGVDGFWKAVVAEPRTWVKRIWCVALAYLSKRQDGDGRVVIGGTANDQFEDNVIALGQLLEVPTPAGGLIDDAKAFMVNVVLEYLLEALYEKIKDRLEP